MKGEGEGAKQGENVAKLHVGDAAAGWNGEQEQADEGHERGGECGKCGCGDSGWAQRGHEREDGDDDDHQAGDEGGVGGGGVGEAEGLELIAEGEEEAGRGSGEELRTGERAELAVVEGYKGDGGEGKAEKVEEERRGLGEGGFDESEGGSPEECGGEEEDAGYMFWGHALGVNGSGKNCPRAGRAVLRTVLHGFAVGEGLGETLRGVQEGEENAAQGDFAAGRVVPLRQRVDAVAGTAGG